MGAVLMGLLLFFVFVSMRMSTPDMKMLYTDLSATDSGAMAARLDTANIPYEVSTDGTKISVPGDAVSRARMLLAQDGLPNGGSMGYELFDKQAGFGTTNFVQNINQVRALEGELARTIGSIDQVRSARVHLVLPQRELFSRESRPSSASVFLNLRPGARLDNEQILSIQSLVASGVPDLKPDKVAIVDSAGNLLARAGEDDASLSGAKADELRRSYETRTSQSLEDIIGHVVGYGKVRVNVTADMDFDRVTTNQEVYDPEQQVVRSSQTVSDKSTEREQSGGDVSVQNNLPAISGDLLNDKPTSEGNRTEETTNYEIGKTVRNMVHEGGSINRQSVAVLVDGNYTTDDKGVKTYQPRSDDEIKKIESLVKTAIGFDEKRGDTIEVVNMQFADIDAGDISAADDNKLLGFEKSDLLDAVEIITVAIMVILVILLVLQPMVGRLLANDGPNLGDDLENDLLAARPANPALMGPDSLRSEEFRAPSTDDEESLIDMQAVEGKVKASSVKKVEDIVENYPAETVSVLRSWMTQET